jgi:hypothetical protein
MGRGQRRPRPGSASPPRTPGQFYLFWMTAGSPSLLSGGWIRPRRVVSPRPFLYVDTGMESRQRRECLFLAGRAARDGERRRGERGPSEPKNPIPWGAYSSRGGRRGTGRSGGPQRKAGRQTKMTFTPSGISHDTERSHNYGPARQQGKRQQRDFAPWQDRRAHPRRDPGGLVEEEQVRPRQHGVHGVEGALQGTRRHAEARVVQHVQGSRRRRQRDPRLRGREGQPGDELHRGHEGRGWVPGQGDGEGLHPRRGRGGLPAPVRDGDRGRGRAGPGRRRRRVAATAPGGA